MSCSSCNTKCKHCYISYKGDMTGEDLYDMCKSLKDRYKIIINGTEVLLHDDYFKALILSDQKRILTNGIKIYQDDSILEKVKEAGIYNVAMSYHYGNEVSEVPKMVVEKSIEYIKRRKMNPELMCTITKDNYDKIEEICEKTVELGVKTLRLFNCINTGNCLENQKDISLNSNQLKIFFTKLKKMRSLYNKEELKIKRNGAFGIDLTSESCNFRCTAGVDEVVITPDGKVYPCIFLTAPQYQIGIYKDSDIQLFYDIINDGRSCIAHDEYNKQEKSFKTKILQRLK